MAIFQVSGKKTSLIYIPVPCAKNELLPDQEQSVQCHVNLQRKNEPHAVFMDFISEKRQEKTCKSYPTFSS